jgi:predicted transcriptional regulator
MLQEEQEPGSNETTQANRTEIESSLNKVSISDLISTLKNLKAEEKQLLIQRKELQATENDLRNQAIAEIDDKKKALTGLKTEIAFIQNKCEELEQALGISAY